MFRFTLGDGVMMISMLKGSKRTSYVRESFPQTAWWIWKKKGIYEVSTPLNKHTRDRCREYNYADNILLNFFLSSVQR